MFDLAGNSRLESPETLTLKGNNQTVEIIMSSDQTLDQFIYEAGKNGSLGDLSLGGDDGILKAMAMQVTIESEDSAFSITATKALPQGDLQLLGSTNSKPLFAT